MSERRDEAAESERPGRPRAAAPRNAEEALADAGRHARAALAETLAAVHSLLDAASLVASGEPAESRRLLGPIARTLEGLAADLEGADREGPRALLAAIAEALDAEIARWELRARDDVDARAVLRAFLGLRELLWEFGVRMPDAGGARPRDEARPRRAGARRARPRVQRVRVEG